MKQIIEKITLRKALFCTAIFAAFFVLINYTEVGVAGLLKITNGATILDFKFGYSTADAHNIITALGEQGRAFYLAKIIPIDFPFPLAYMLCYAGWIALLVKHVAPLGAAKLLLVLPLLAMLFDWIENIGIIFILTQYPDIAEKAVALASASGILKSLFTQGSIITIIVLLIIYILRKILKSVRTSKN